MKEKKIPLRKCVGCNKQFDKRTMIRIVKTKENEFSVDFTGKANGRGAYICKKIECFEAAQKKNAFSRAFGMKIPDEIYEQLKKEFTDEQ
ncbi:MAG: YlxR family protein [Bacillota bacterium]|nr:YlxR family protein [Bacillota bacterium]